MVQGCEDYARRNNLDPIVIAIFNASGNLKIFARQDFARTGSIDFAMVKGRTAAVLGITTDALGKTDYADPGRPMGIASAEGLTIVQGGVPIFAADGTLLGGIGVSGAPSAHDEACGKAGIAAVKDILN